MKRLKTMKAVYCYYFPEVRQVLDKVELPDDMFKVTASAEEMEDRMKKEFDIEINIPRTEYGCVDLDLIHEPIIKRIVRIYGSSIPGLDRFNYTYPTSGSSEGIFHMLVKLKVDGIRSIYVLDGEYEGYAAQCKNIGMEVISVSPEEIDKPEKIDNLNPGVWFISNPSARDGNIIPNEFIRNLCDKGHKIILDLAYVGNTQRYEFFVDHENIIAAVMSFSKPYGVFRFRIGGFIFTREAVLTLYGTKWFKDITRLFQALRIAEDIGPEKLHKRYKSWQDLIIKEINEEYGLGIMPSDAFLLGYLPVEEAKNLDKDTIELIAPFNRLSDNSKQLNSCLSTR